MEHKDKVKLARKLKLREVEAEKDVKARKAKQRIPIFQTMAWELKVKRIKQEVAKREAHQKETSRLRRERLTARTS